MVTGGAGFVGSNLCRLLLRRGAYVDCVDNMITGRRESVDDLEGDRRFRLFECDVSDTRFAWQFSRTKYDEIYHLACPTGVPNIETLGEEMMETCSIGTGNVLRLAKSAGAKVLLSSSAEVYGDPEVSPQGERYCGSVDPVGPRSAYEEGKRFSEALVKLYSRKYGVDGRIVRIFNTFGPGMSPSDQRVIPQFLVRALTGDPVIVYGDGNQTRTFLYIDDLLNGFEAVMQFGEKGGVYNIGGTESFTIRELYSIVKEVVEGDIAIEFRPHFILDHAGRMPDTTRVRELGWRPKTPIFTGLQQSYLYLKGKVAYAGLSARPLDILRDEPDVLGGGRAAPVNGGAL